MSKPNYPECKRCGGEDCVCCEVWVDAHNTYDRCDDDTCDYDYDAHWLGDEDEYYNDDDDEECEDEE